MNREDTTPTALLQLVRQRLIDQLGLDEGRCFIGWTPRNPLRIPRGGQWFLAVCPAGGVFEPGEQCPAQLTENWQFDVAIYLRSNLDRPDEIVTALLGEQRGLYAIKKQVLAALVGHDFGTGQRATVTCRRATAPEPVESAGQPQITLWLLVLSFELPFDWALQ